MRPLNSPPSFAPRRPSGRVIRRSIKSSLGIGARRKIVPRSACFFARAKLKHSIVSLQFETSNFQADETPSPMKLQIVTSLSPFFTLRGAARRSSLPFPLIIPARIQRGKRNYRFTLCAAPAGRENARELFEEISLGMSEKLFRLTAGSVLTPRAGKTGVARNSGGKSISINESTSLRERPKETTGRKEEGRRGRPSISQ